MNGICCVCQSQNPVRESSDEVRRLMAEDEGWTEISDIEAALGEEIFYVMDIHDFCGQHCEGSGQTPQALV